MSVNGFTLWFTGLSGSGKTTLATQVCAELSKRGCRVELLDGDALRESLSPELGFSPADRNLHVKRIGYLAQMLSRNGVVAVVAAISPYRAARAEVRRLHDGRFVEVHLACALPELIRRDPKGLYSKALSGEIGHFTGVSDPYEVPDAPELTLFTEHESPLESRARLLNALEEQGMIPSLPSSSFDVGHAPRHRHSRPGFYPHQDHERAVESHATDQAN